MNTMNTINSTSSRWQNWLYAVIALICGALLTLAFAPWQWYPLAIISPAIFLYTLLHATPKQGFWRGFLFGFGLFGSGISWVYISIHVFGNTPIFLSTLLTGLFVAVLALFIATQCWALCRYFPANTLSKLLLVFPTLWVLQEWTRSWFLTGFPWLYVGYTQMTSPLRGYAPLFSVYGLTFLTILTSAMLIAILITKRKRWYLLISGIVALWGLGVLLTPIQWTQSLNGPITTSVVQGNIAQELKWDPKQFAQTMRTYYDMSAPHWDSRLVVWPEAAIPILPSYIPGYLNQLNSKALMNHATLITGIPVQDLAGRYYNAMESMGTDHGSYYKRHLVPFGEYVPLENLLRGIISFFNLPMSNFSSGPMHQTTLHVGTTTLAPYICYEIAYPMLVRADFPKANLILTISDDSWFGRSIAQPQHLQMAQMRSLETGRDQIFSTNDGTTALIDAKGRIIESIPPFTATVLNGKVQPMYGTTPWIWYGDYPLLALFVVFLLFAWFRQKSN